MDSSSQELSPGAVAAQGTAALRPERALDPRDPHPTRTGIFRDHNCWKCRNGELPCVSRTNLCEYPHARND